MKIPLVTEGIQREVLLTGGFGQSLKNDSKEALDF